MTSPRPFTADWADALRTAINGDAGYRAVAGDWIWPVLLVLDPAPEYGYTESSAVLFELDRGVCTSASLVSVAATDAPFVLRASYKVWKRIVRGVTDPVMAVMLNQVRLQGSLAVLMQHAAAAKALIACARAVPTHFPDEDA